MHHHICPLTTSFFSLLLKHHPDSWSRWTQILKKAGHATTGMKNLACVLVLDLSKNWSPSLFLVFSFSYFTLKVNGPQFETGRRRSPASRGHELVCSHCWSHAWINRSVGHLAQKLCQIRFVDPSIVAARWEIRRQPKVPIKLNKYGSSVNRYLVRM